MCVNIVCQTLFSKVHLPLVSSCCRHAITQLLLELAVGMRLSLGQQNVNGWDWATPIHYSLLLFLFWLVVMATSRMALEATYSRWQNLCQLGFLNEGWSRTLHPNTHIISHLPGLLHNDTITTFVEPLQICSSLLSKCSLNY